MQNNRLTGIKLLLSVILLIWLGLAVETGYANEEQFNLDEYLLNVKQLPDYETEENSSSLLMSFAKMFTGLVVVLTVAYITLRFIKKINNFNKVLGWMQILAYDTIGPNKGICLVKIGGRNLLLGVTEHNINLLSELSEDELAEIDFADIAGNSGTTGKQEGKGFYFHQYLQNSISKIQDLNRDYKKAKGDSKNG